MRRDLQPVRTQDAARLMAGRLWEALAPAGVLGHRSANLRSLGHPRPGFVSGRLRLNKETDEPEPIPPADKVNEPAVHGDIYLLIVRARMRYLDGEDFADALLEEAGADLY